MFARVPGLSVSLGFPATVTIFAKVVPEMAMATLLAYLPPTRALERGDDLANGLCHVE